MTEENIKNVIEALRTEFPDAKSELKFNSPFQLLVSVILSAQCTDKRVNAVTPALFSEAGTPELMAKMPISRLEELIHSCGFYHSKAKYLSCAAVDIVNRFGGEVPSDLDSLRTLAGVGRKTANVVYAVGFGGQAIAVDTHVFRVSNRLGLAHANNVLDTEKQLMEALPQKIWSQSHHLLLLHGRYICKSQRPLCDRCPVTECCEYYNTNGKES